MRFAPATPASGRGTGRTKSILSALQGLFARPVPVEVEDLFILLFFHCQKLTKPGGIFAASGRIGPRGARRFDASTSSATAKLSDRFCGLVEGS